jgi:hypothetical protein
MQLILALLFVVHAHADVIKTPAGQSFTITKKSGPRMLTVTYTSTDPKAAKTEANDLMSALLVEAEHSGVENITITATAAAQTITTVFKRQPSGMWLDATVKDTSVADKWKTALLARYTLSDQAYHALNFQKIQSLQSPNFVHHLADGKQRSGSEELAIVKTAVKKVESWQTKMLGFFIVGDHVFVSTDQQWTGVVNSGGKDSHLKDASTCLDEWNLKSLLMEASFDVKDESKPL